MDPKRNTANPVNTRNGEPVKAPRKSPKKIKRVPIKDISIKKGK
jgi:hypothetical protein